MMGLVFGKFECDYCKRSFMRLAELTKHEETFHGRVAIE